MTKFRSSRFGDTKHFSSSDEGASSYVNSKGGTGFDVSKDVTVVCHTKDTRNGFKHEATLYVDGVERETAKVNYLNRTWESYEYETVLQKLSEKTDSLSASQKADFDAFIKNPQRGKDDLKRAGFGNVAMVAQMGEVFGQTQKEKNDWKERMLKAGLGSKGLDMPEDWDTLSENEKERRLNKVIAEFKRSEE